MEKIRAIKTPLLTALFFLTTIIVCIDCRAQLPEGSYVKELNALVQNGGYIITRDQKTILSLNPDNTFVPASTWKMLTALAAIEKLGQEFCFTTEFYADEKDNLYIKGFGDPFLTSEEISAVLYKLKDLHINIINNICLDDSSFEVSEPPAGAADNLRPYNVTNGALAVNFNTINLIVSRDGTISSAEKQTPALPIMQELGESLSPGCHRINISQDPENVLRYVGELFRALQARYGISGSGEIIVKKIPAGLQPCHMHCSSKRLSDIIEEMMLYSNNFIANQLYLYMSGRESGYPATWDKARMSLEDYVNNAFSAYKDEIIIDEGSGLSRDNRISPRAMLAVLERFKPYARLLPLNKGRRIKSGTMNNIYSYAGYFMDNGTYDPFVIILNQSGNNRGEALDLMERIYRKSP